MNLGADRTGDDGASASPQALLEHQELISSTREMVLADARTTIAKGGFSRLERSGEGWIKRLAREKSVAAEKASRSAQWAGSGLTNGTSLRQNETLCLASTASPCPEK